MKYNETTQKIINVPFYISRFYNKPIKDLIQYLTEITKDSISSSLQYEGNDLYDIPITYIKKIIDKTENEIK